VPPPGVVDVQATGINDSDVISVQASTEDGGSLAFAVTPKARGFTWIPLQTGSLHCEFLSVAGVAANGDIDGGLTLILPHGGVQVRSVLWRVRSDGTYRAAELLPMSPAFVGTVAGGIWRRNGQTYVSGGQGQGGPLQDASLWSPSPTLTFVPDEMLFASAIGGTAQHVYAAGTMRSDAMRAGFSEIVFDRTGSHGSKQWKSCPARQGISRELPKGFRSTRKGDPLWSGMSSPTRTL
jgi:hypothetical protein